MGAIITSQNAINAIVKIIAQNALESLIGNLVMGQLVNRNFEAALAQTGDTVNVPIGPTLTANNIAEGGTINNQVASLGNAQVVLNTHAEASFQIADLTKVLVQPDLSKLYMDAAIKALAERIETDIMKVYPLLTDNTAVGGVAAITESVIDDAETTLFKSKVPSNEPKYLVCTADTYADIRQIPKFSENQTIGMPATATIEDGTVGRLKNFNVIRSQYVQTSGGTAYNMAFARDAIALVTRQLPEIGPGLGAVSSFANMGGFGMRVIMSFAQSSLSTQFTTDVLYGVGTLRNVFGVQVQTNT